jgi:hypothetical protein
MTMRPLNSEKIYFFLRVVSANVGSASVVSANVVRICPVRKCRVRKCRVAREIPIEMTFVDWMNGQRMGMGGWA